MGHELRLNNKAKDTTKIRPETVPLATLGNDSTEISSQKVLAILCRFFFKSPINVSGGHLSKPKLFSAPKRQAVGLRGSSGLMEESG